MMTKAYLAVLGTACIALLTPPATAQYAGAASPIADDTPVDLLAIQAPCGKEDFDRGSKDRLYVQDSKSHIILAAPYKAQASRPTQTLRGGGQWHLLAASCNRRLVAASPDGSGSVELISTKNQEVIAKLALPVPVRNATFTTDSKELWLSSGRSKEVYIASVNHPERIQKIPLVFHPTAIAANIKDRAMFIMDGDGGLFAIDAKSHKQVGKASTNFGRGSQMMVSPTDKELWIVRSDRPQVAIMRTDAPYETIKTIDLPDIGSTIQFVRRGNRNIAFVGLPASRKIAVIDGDHFKVVNSIPLRGTPETLTASGDGSNVYVGFDDKMGIDVVDADRFAITSSIATNEAVTMILHVADAAKSRL
ncbi:YncE family protein [Sphingomonas parapaucimobilis]|uniref:YncE family protein n=1 Tax=Sphingomonas parapaucimobilis TaxID=28213 RepID=UPI0035C81DC0